jgi:hypothetical protein
MSQQIDSPSPEKHNGGKQKKEMWEYRRADATRFIQEWDVNWERVEEEKVEEIEEVIEEEVQVAWNPYPELIDGNIINSTKCIESILNNAIQILEIRLPAPKPVILAPVVVVPKEPLNTTVKVPSSLVIKNNFKNELEAIDKILGKETILPEADPYNIGLGRFIPPSTMKYTSNLSPADKKIINGSSDDELLRQTKPAPSAPSNIESFSSEIKSSPIIQEKELPHIIENTKPLPWDTSSISHLSRNAVKSPIEGYALRHHRDIFKNLSLNNSSIVTVNVESNKQNVTETFPSIEENSKNESDDNHLLRFPLNSMKIGLNIQSSAAASSSNKLNCSQYQLENNIINTILKENNEIKEDISKEKISTHSQIEKIPLKISIHKVDAPIESRESYLYKMKSLRESLLDLVS